MHYVVQNNIRNGFYTQCGVRKDINDPLCFYNTHSRLVKDSIHLLVKNKTYDVLNDFIDRHGLHNQFNVTMFSAFSPCNRQQVMAAVHILETRMRRGGHIAKPLACLISLLRAIEHGFLRGEDLTTYRYFCENVL